MSLLTLSRPSSSDSLSANQHQGSRGVDHPRAERAVRELLFAIGEDPDREGLIDTPSRVARAYSELFAGLEQDPAQVLGRVFDQPSGDLVSLRNIPFFSSCEHHLLPFSGRASIAYLPANGKVVGLSKLARLVEVYARRPQLQERLTAQIADALMEHLEAEGASVMVHAEHLCMKARGVRKDGAEMTTTAHRGRMADDRELRAEVLGLIDRD